MFIPVLLVEKQLLNLSASCLRQTVDQESEGSCHTRVVWDPWQDGQKLQASYVKSHGEGSSFVVRVSQSRKSCWNFLAMTCIRSQGIFNIVNKVKLSRASFMPFQADPYVWKETIILPWKLLTHEQHFIFFRWPHTHGLREGRNQ